MKLDQLNMKLTGGKPIISSSVIIRSSRSTADTCKGERGNHTFPLHCVVKKIGYF